MHGEDHAASDLAERYDTAWAPEYVRGYLDAKGSPLDASDVDPIARGQMAAEDAARRSAFERGRPLVILDTDLVSTVVYARHYYGACPAWVEEAARARRGHLYLLLHPDVPWLPDSQRDRPRQRGIEELQEFSSLIKRHISLTFSQGYLPPKFS